MFINTVRSEKVLSFMQTIAPLWLWIVFVGFVLAALFVDFVLLKKQGAHEVGVKQALNWSLVWVGLSFVFNALFWWAVKDSTGATQRVNASAMRNMALWAERRPTLSTGMVYRRSLVTSRYTEPRSFVQKFCTSDTTRAKS